MIENHKSSSREQTGVRKAILKKNLKEVLDEATLAGLKPLIVGITVIYATFTAFNITGKVLPGYAFSIILTMDLTMLSVSIVLLLFLNRGLVGQKLAHPVGTLLAILLIANVLITLVVLKVPFHTTYLVLICVGAGCFMLSRVWLAFIFCVCGASWFVVVRHFSPTPELIYYALALFAGAVLSLVIQRSRREAIISVFELRHSDALSREHLARELHNSEFRYQQIVETAYEGIGITDQDGMIVYVNPRIAKMVGRTVEDMIGKRFLHIVHPEDREFAATRSGARDEAGNEQYDCRFQHSNGETVWCLVSASPLRDASGNFLGSLGLITDVSAHKRVEESQKRYSRRLEALQEVDRAILAAKSPLAIAEAVLPRTFSLAPCDIACVLLKAPDKKEASILSFDGGNLVRHDMRVGELLKCNECRRETGVHEGDLLASQRKCAITERLAPGVIRSLVCEPFSVEGEWLGGLLFGSQKKRALAAEHREIARELADKLALSLRQTHLRKTAETEQNRLKAIIAELPEAVLVLDGQRRIRSLNPPAEVHMHMLAECGIDDVLTEFGGYSLEDLLSAGDQRSWKTLTVDDDPPKHFEAVARRLVDAGADGYIVVSRDVTQKKLDQEQIQAQQRIAAVGQLAAGIAHDFNNILQSMLMSGEMLKLNGALSDDGIEQVDSIIRQTGRASTLVRQILDFSRKSVRTGRPLKLSKSVAETVQLLQRTISERVELSFEVIADASDAVITGDAAQLQQLVTNFVINAQDAMPQGGKVRLSLEGSEFGKHDDRPFPSMPSGKWLVLSVADEGCGIPSKLQSRVYEPFFTTKRPGKGTGLGLAQAYGIVKQHEGFIDLVSAPEEGTTFSVYLPHKMDEEIQQPPEPKKLNLRGNGEIVVVIEDQASLLRIIKRTLESFGFEVYAISDADEAIAECQRLGDAVDVVLSDVVMPRRSGPEVFRTIRGKCRNAGFILMSGYPLSEHPDEVTAIENVDWLQKPFEISKLVEVVSKAARQ